jgi:hypothetical protein
VAGDGGADEGVEDLVEAEDLRREVGPAAVIAEGTEDLEHPAGDEENQSGGGEVVQQHREGGHGEPAQAQVDTSDEPLGGGEPARLLPPDPVVEGAGGEHAGDAGRGDAGGDLTGK